MSKHDPKRFFFMILMLDRKVMNGITGVARYRQEWAEAM